MTTSLLTPAGDSLAISIESQVSEVSSLSNEELESRVIGAFMKIADALPYILELRQRFADARTRGEQILGYTGWTDFCERNLRRTPRAIQMAIRDAQPNSKPCPYCDEMFASNGEMKRHKRKVHSEVMKAQAAPYIDARAQTAVPQREESESPISNESNNTSQDEWDKALQDAVNNARLDKEPSLPQSEEPESKQPSNLAKVRQLCEERIPSKVAQGWDVKQCDDKSKTRLGRFDFTLKGVSRTTIEKIVEILNANA
jgi:hypothetical protein